MLDTDKWIKYSYGCLDCGSLIEYTCKLPDDFPSGSVTEITCICGGKAGQVSVEDATILPITEQKEDKMQEVVIAPQEYNPNTLVTYKAINNGVTEFITDKVQVIEYALDQYRRTSKNLIDKQNAWYTKEQKLRSLLDESYADSQDQETLAEIADIFDVPLTKEVEVTAWVRVDLTLEVDMREGDYDIESLVADNLTVDSYSSEVQVTNFEVERTEDGAY